MSTARLSPHLNFKGICREAMTFYQSVLGGTLSMHTYDEMMPDSEKRNDNIMHAKLENEGLLLMASDSLDSETIIRGNSVQLCLEGPNQEGLAKVFDDLSKGGSVELPLERQVWGDYFGMLTDKFGIHWMVDINVAKKVSSEQDSSPQYVSTRAQ